MLLIKLFLLWETNISKKYVLFTLKPLHDILNELMF